MLKLNKFFKKYNFIILIALLLCILAVLILCFHKSKEPLTNNNNSILPFQITVDNFDKYFKVDPGVSNCKNNKASNSPGEFNETTGCPSLDIVKQNKNKFFPKPGVISWAQINGQWQFPTMISNNKLFQNGTGFLGFIIKSMPGPLNSPKNNEKSVWNSIWLMGSDINNCNNNPSLSCLEIDIYETMYGINGNWSWPSPKIGFHNWPNGYGSGKLGPGVGCFGAYLNPIKLGDNGSPCKNDTPIIVKPKNSNGVDTPPGSSWYTVITNDDKGPRVFIGISKSGWLPSSSSDIEENFYNKSDFILDSGPRSIVASTKGFNLLFTSTSSPDKAAGLSPNLELNLPKITYLEIPAEQLNPDKLSNSQKGSQNIQPQNQPQNQPHHDQNQGKPVQPSENKNNNNVPPPITNNDNSKGSDYKDAYCYTTEDINKGAHPIATFEGNQFSSCSEKCHSNLNCDYFKGGKGWCQLFSGSPDTNNINCGSSTMSHLSFYSAYKKN